MARRHELDDALAAFIEAGSAAWPEVAADAAVLVGVLRARLASASDPVSALGELRAPDLYLATACAAGDGPALATFEAAMLAPAARALRRIDSSQHFVSEVLQIVRQRLFVAEPGNQPKIATYSGAGDLKSWVRVVAVREALQLKRRGGKEALAADVSIFDRVAGAADPLLERLKMGYRGQLERAFQNALASLSSKERNLLRLNAIDGLSIDELGKLNAVNRATAARWLERIRSRLLKRTRAELMRNFDMNSADCDSLITLVNSNLDASIKSVLVAAPEAER